MIVEGDELCDDGNQNDYDECNNDCVPPGEVLWSAVIDGGAAGISEAATSVTVGPDGAVYVGGSFAGDARDAVVTRFSPDRQTEDQAVLYATPGTDIVYDLEFDAAGRLLGVGVFAPEVWGWLAEIDPDTLELGASVEAADAVSFWYTVMPFDGSVFVGGFDESLGEAGSRAAAVRTYSTALAEVSSEPSFDGGATPPSGSVRKIAGDSLGIYVAGSTEGTDGFRDGFCGDHPNTWVDLLDSTDDAYYRGLAIAAPEDSESLIWCSGFVLEAPSRRAILKGVRRDGTVDVVVDDYLGVADEGALYTTVAVDSEGNVVVVGSSRLNESGDPTIDGRLLVRKLSPDASEELWTRAPDFPGFDYGTAADVHIADGDHIFVAGYVADQSLVQRRVVLELGR